MALDHGYMAVAIADTTNTIAKLIRTNIERSTNLVAVIAATVRSNMIEATAVIDDVAIAGNDTVAAQIGIDTVAAQARIDAVEAVAVTGGAVVQAVDVATAGSETAGAASLTIVTNTTTPINIIEITARIILNVNRMRDLPNMAVGIGEAMTIGSGIVCKSRLSRNMINMRRVRRR